MSWPGNRSRRSAASWLGYVAKAELAPAPAVDDEPMATMVSGAPLARWRIVCNSGRSKCVNAAGALHATGGAAAARAGAGKVVGMTAGLIRLDVAGRAADAATAGTAAGVAEGAATGMTSLGIWVRQNAQAALAHWRPCAVQQSAPQKMQSRPRPAPGRRVLFACLGTLTRCLHSHGVKMSRVYDLRRQGPANALMNTSRHIIFLGSGIEVEGPRIVPVMHDGQPIEQQRAALLRDPAHDIGIGGNIEHRFRARAVLHVHQDDVGIGGLDLGRRLDRGCVRKSSGSTPLSASAVPACHTTSDGLSSARILPRPDTITAVVSRD